MEKQAQSSFNSFQSQLSLKNDASRYDDIFKTLQSEARKQFPQTIYSAMLMKHYQQVKKTKLYKIFQTIPKVVLQHVHLECCADKEYYRQYVITDPRVFFNSELTQFKLGTQQQAKQNNWISMNELRSRYQSQDQFINFVSSFTIFTQNQYQKMNTQQIDIWKTFDNKIFNFMPILQSVHHFKSYMKHICQNFINNQYDRVQFRAFWARLTQYDQQGNIIQIHSQSKYMQILDQVQLGLQQNYPYFTLGIIFHGLKMLSAEQSEEYFTKICQLNWSKTIGFDFLQQQDVYGSLEKYDQILVKVLQKYPHLPYKRVYHAGQSVQTTNNNVQLALKYKSYRIGHGITILFQSHLIPQCKNTCFQINPVSNLILGLIKDARVSHAPVLMGMGVPITINCDDPGTFGYDGSTFDYFISAISNNWGLKQFKMLGQNSIKYAICDQLKKQQLFKNFQQKWVKWLKTLLVANQQEENE